MRVLNLIAALIGILTSAGPLSAGRFVAIADADTIVSAVVPNANFGAVGSLRVGLTPVDQPSPPQDPQIMEGVQRALLHFDLSEIPHQAQIIRAELRVFQRDLVIGQGLHVLEVQQSWEEMAVKWTTRPRTGDALGTMRLAASSFVSFVNANLTALVQAWVDGTGPNHGIELRLHDEVAPMMASMGQRADTLLSRETPIASQRPRLIVDYIIPEPATLALFAGALPWIMRRSRPTTPR